jgi:hypothetical protein
MTLPPSVAATTGVESRGVSGLGYPRMDLLVRVRSR